MVDYTKLKPEDIVKKLLLSKNLQKKDVLVTDLPQLRSIFNHLGYDVVEKGFVGANDGFKRMRQWVVRFEDRRSNLRQIAKFSKNPPQVATDVPPDENN